MANTVFSSVVQPEIIAKLSLSGVLATSTGHVSTNCLTNIQIKNLTQQQWDGVSKNTNLIIYWQNIGLTALIAVVAQVDKISVSVGESARRSLTNYYDTYPCAKLHRGWWVDSCQTSRIVIPYFSWNIHPSLSMWIRSKILSKKRETDDWLKIVENCYHQRVALGRFVYCSIGEPRVAHDRPEWIDWLWDDNFDSVI